MSTLARLSGVPAATIKHYLREGLLPGPEIKTSRNSALYDPALAERIKQIKTLQREHFLPLRVIKSVLEGRPSEADDAETKAAIGRALTAMAPREVRTRSELLASGARAEELALFEGIGLITPRKIDGEDAFTGDDLALLRLLATSRRAGITEEMLPPDIVGPYIHAIRELVRVELEMFRRGVVPRAGDDLAAITDAATRLSEQLVVLVRRKMLLPTLEALVKEHESSATSDTPKKKKKTKAAAKRRTKERR
jgi:DNA-binding transcriptional MerR regulator